MLRITKQTDYGIVLLSRMAAEPARLFNAPELAAELGLPLPTVSKILKLLARDGVLASHRGVKGGYSLSRPPEAISVAEAERRAWSMTLEPGPWAAMRKMRVSLSRLLPTT